MDAMLDSVDSEQLTELLAFERIEIDDESYRHAQLCHLIAVTHITKGAPKFEDFLPRRAPQRETSPEEFVAMMMSLGRK